ncbi:carbohydrate kinase [Blastopirellula sp. JC732]|uniref:Carbohydrate kinase n=1 Tax=Blastopirellula sediminis TaxID=2894196 RepID=A0A9X1MLE1_9BACT|nr:carbohydrate kinase [Blastopirellula sediminis]MCC9608858.1 carbohydrate kinase [Blastopirellula sediminis]MCC9628365.1 carbohydrate kinase [Blastopirellula sediminis]
MTDSRPVIGLGEILWDCFPDERRPGGAPANFAFHAGQLGLNGVVLSRVGTDELGDEFLQYLAHHGLSDQYVQRDPAHATGQVRVEFVDGDPTYTFVDDVAWDHLEFTPETAVLCSKAAVICFGTLAQRSRDSQSMIYDCLRAAPTDAWKIYDINLRPPWFSKETIESSLALANALKLNEDEVAYLAENFDLPTEIESFAAEVQRFFGLQAVCITLGGDGCLVARGDEQCRQPGIPITIADTVGAGDSFTAAIAHGLVHEKSVAEMAGFANQVAALVASHAGAMPDLRAKIAEIS